MPNQDMTKSTNAVPARRGDLFDTMRHEVNRLFDSFDRGSGWPSFLRADTNGLAGLDIDVRDDGSAVVIEAEIPGVSEKDVSVTFADGLLTISGEKRTEKEEKKDSYYLSERSFGSFRRTLRLPDSVDDSKIDAHFDKGVLKITAGKKPEAVKSERKIEIKTT